MRARVGSLLALVFAITCMSVGLFAHRTHAQLDVLVAPDVTLKVVPEIPGPKDEVSAYISSLSYNLQSTEFTWTLDGKLILQGIGKDNVRFKIGDVGVQSKLVVRVAPVNAPATIKTAIITPQGMDILWQAKDSVVPPLYRGKALAAKEGTVTFVAIPGLKTGSNTLAKQESLLYLWRLDGAENSLSGYGKSAFEVKMTYLDESLGVSVNAATRDESLRGAAEASFIPFEPKVIWYETNAFYGPNFNTALENDHEVSDTDISLIAEPYFFSPKSIYSPQMKYTWKLNNNPLDIPRIPNNISLHRSDSSQGEALIDIAITNVNKLFQATKGTLRLKLL